MTRNSLEENIFFLGADDPEMKVIENEILIPLGLEYEYAQIDGQRVNPANAYQAENTGDKNSVLIECGGPNLSGIKIDHHREGDPGFSIGPRDFFNASSLGQLLGRIFGKVYTLETYNEVTEALKIDEKFFQSNLIRFQEFECPKGSDRWQANLMDHWFLMPERYVLTAASDHCLAAAYRGECPGVNIGALKEFQIVENIAPGTNSTPKEARDEVEKFENMFAQIEPIKFGEKSTRSSQKIYNFRDQDLGKGYSLPYLALKEAGTIGGHPYLIEHDFGNGRRAVMLNGNVSPDMVRYFLDDYVKKENLVEPFGVPERGYAGAYLP